MRWKFHPQFESDLKPVPPALTGEIATLLEEIRAGKQSADEMRGRVQRCSLPSEGAGDVFWARSRHDERWLLGLHVYVCVGRNPQQRSVVDHGFDLAQDRLTDYGK